jgi:hypothetical protein
MNTCNHGLLRICERIGGNESFNLVFSQMMEDRKILQWFVDLLYNHKQMVWSGRVWSMTMMYGHFRPLPILFVYLNDVQITETRRVFKVTCIDWQRNIHGVVDIYIKIYPELVDGEYYIIRQPPKIKYRHTCAMKNIVFGFDTRDFHTMISECVKEALWLMDSCCVEGVYDLVHMRKMMRLHSTHFLNNAVFSTRLMSVLTYACRLQNAIRLYIINKCSCAFKGSDSCKCLSLCLNIRDRFPEGNLLHDNVVLFKT